MPIIVDRGDSSFKFIEDGRAKDAAANYTYVRAEDFPQELQYMLDRNYDTTAPSQSTPPTQGAGRGAVAQGSGGGYGGGGGGSARYSTGGGGNYTARTQAEAQGGWKAPSLLGPPPVVADARTRPLVDSAGGAPEGMTAQQVGPVSAGIPPRQSAWLQFTPVAETAPLIGGGQGRPQAAQVGAEPAFAALPIGRPPTGDLLQDRYGGYDPTAGLKYPLGSPMYKRTWMGEIEPPVSFANNQPSYGQPAGGYDFSTVNAVLNGLQNGSIVLPGWR